MTTRTGITLALLALFLPWPVAEAEEARPVGYVMKVDGEASVLHAGQSLPASVGLALHVGDSLHTGDAGSMGVTLEDNTVMSLGPNSELSVDRFLYAPAQDQLGFSAMLRHGTLNFIDGIIAKLRPEAVELKTPSGTIGVRGTHFLVKVDG